MYAGASDTSLERTLRLQIFVQMLCNIGFQSADNIRVRMVARIAEMLGNLHGQHPDAFDRIGNRALKPASPPIMIALTILSSFDNERLSA